MLVDRDLLDIIIQIEPEMNHRENKQIRETLQCRDKYAVESVPLVEPVFRSDIAVTILLIIEEYEQL